jgi:quercetin dioxygenase-like cupin family protein
MPQPFIVTPSKAPRPLKVVGEEITVLASGAQTGSYEIFRQAGPEGSGPPPHKHEWDEAFVVVKGEIEFGVGGETSIAAPGTLVHLPAGTVHWFRFLKGGGEMISMTSREGASAAFADIDREMPPGPPDVEKLVGIVARHGIRVSVPKS